MRYGSIRKFAWAIERNVQETERGSIPTFNDLSPEMVAEVRAVRKVGGPMAASSYLLFFVREQSDGDADSFCEEVIDGGADVASWRTGDRLVGVAEWDRVALRLSVVEYISILEGIAGDRWYRSRLTSHSKEEIPVSDMGPGMLIRGMRYWTKLDVPKPSNLIRIVAIGSMHEVVERVPDADIDAAIRRWMASTAAWWTEKYLLSEGPRATVDGILAAYPEPVTPSVDGMIALRALVQEARSGDSRWPGQVGFIGPDDWYR